MCNPVRAGVAAADDPVLAGKGVLSLRGACWRGKVDVVDLGLDRDASAAKWEGAIERVGRGLTFSSQMEAAWSRVRSEVAGGGPGGVQVRGGGYGSHCLGQGDCWYAAGIGVSGCLPCLGPVRFPGGDCIGSECCDLRFGSVGELTGGG